MSRNFLASSYCDVVQGPLALEPGKRPFHGLPLLQKSLTFEGVLYSVLRQQPFMPFVQLDDGSCSILAAHQSKKLSAGISGVCHDVFRVKLSCRRPSFPQHIRGPLGIMDVSWANIGSDGQFVLTVNQQVQLPAVSQFLGALGSHLDRPSRLRVGLWGLTTIAPTLQRCAIEGYSLTKPRQSLVMLASQGTGNIFDTGQILGELPEEPAKCGFVRDVIRRDYPASLSNEWVVVQSPNHRCRGRKPKSVLHYEASPERLDRMPFRASADGTFQSFKQSRIVEFGEDALKLVNDGRTLSRTLNGCMMEQDHGKPQPSCWFRGRRRRKRLRPRLLYTERILRYVPIVNAHRVNNRTNMASTIYTIRIRRGLANSHRPHNQWKRRISSPFYLTAVPWAIYNRISGSARSTSLEIGEGWPRNLALTNLLFGRLSRYLFRSLDSFWCQSVLASRDTLNQICPLVELRVQAPVGRATISNNPFFYQPFDEVFQHYRMVRLIQPVQEHLTESRVTSVTIAVQQRRFHFGFSAQRHIAHRNCAPNLSQMSKQFGFPSRSSFTVCPNSFNVLVGKSHSAYSSRVSSTPQVGQVGVED